MKTELSKKYIKDLCILAFPVMLEQLGQILLGTVDTYFAGKVGDSAIAAVSVTNMFMNLFCTVFLSFGIAVMVMTARALGEKDVSLANRTLRQAILLCAAVGLALGLVNLVFRRSLLRLAGAEGEILNQGMVYYLVVCVPCVILGFIQILACGLKAAQNTKASMNAALTANILNAILDALLVKAGLGVLGLGLATTLSRLVNLLLLLRYYRNGATELTLDTDGWKPEPELLKSILKFSAPIILTRFTARLAMLVHGSIILHLGDAYYVAHSVATQIDEYACIPSEGFEAATATLVSNSVGAGKRKEVMKYTGMAFLSNTVCMTAVGIVLAVFAMPISSLFSKTGEIQEMITQVLQFIVFFDWTSALSHILTSAVQGTGNSRDPLYITLAGCIVMRLGAGYLLAYYVHLGLIGVWIGIVLDFLMRGILLGRVLIKEYGSKKLPE